MKERYTTMRPYGQWLAEQAFTLDDVMASVGPAASAPPGGASANGASGSSNGALAHAENGAGAGAAGEGAGVQLLLQPLKVRPAARRPQTQAGAVGVGASWCGVTVRRLFGFGLCGCRPTHRRLGVAGQLVDVRGRVSARSLFLLRARALTFGPQGPYKLVYRARSHMRALAAACLQHSACTLGPDLTH